MINILTIKLTVLIIGSLVILWTSQRALRKPGTHGSTRFIAWEAILILIVINLDNWFDDPFSWNQIISWILLITSIVLVYKGVKMLRDRGMPNSNRDDPTLVGIEKTTELVTEGIYAHIRHPLYSSLLFLTWGAFFKYPSWSSGCIATVATVFLYITGKIEENENYKFFGESYLDYSEHTKMFIPFIF